jgi:MtN3 and saliva related transmembrane protein
MLWDIIGIVAAGCGCGGLIPQIVRGLKTKRLDDVSPWMLVLLMVGTTLWFFYGIHIRDIIIMGANTLAFALAATILFLRIKYSRKRAQKLLASERTSVYAE